MANEHIEELRNRPPDTRFESADIPNKSAYGPMKDIGIPDKIARKSRKIQKQKSAKRTVPIEISSDLINKIAEDPYDIPTRQKAALEVARQANERTNTGIIHRIRKNKLTNRLLLIGAGCLGGIAAASAGILPSMSATVGYGAGALGKLMTSTADAAKVVWKDVIPGNDAAKCLIAGGGGIIGIRMLGKKLNSGGQATIDQYKYFDKTIKAEEQALESGRITVRKTD